MAEKSDPSRGLGASWPALALILCAGTLVHLPALRASPILDDFLHGAMVEGKFPGPHGPFDLYDFVNDQNRTELAERGMLPWWAHPQLTLRFLRPLSSALRFYELRALSDWPLTMHLHSLAWWAAAVVGVFLLLARSFSRRVALLATATFALGPWHVLPLAWLANREVLIAVAFGSFGLRAYLRWRESWRARDALLSLGLFGLAAAAGEYSLCFGGYVLAMELGVRGQPAWRRLVGLLPFALPAAAYLVLRAALGYGTWGSGFYADPLHAPLTFLRYAPVRLAELLDQAWLTLGTAPWGTSREKWAVVLVALSVIALAVVPLRGLLRALDAPARRTATWLLAGSVLSLVPVLAVVPGPRVVGVSAWGASAVVALLLEHAWFPAGARPRGPAAEITALAALVFGFAQLVHGPVASVLESVEMHGWSASFAYSAAKVGTQMADPSRTEVALVRGSSGMLFGPFALGRGIGPPAQWRGLSHTEHALVLRTAPRSLEIRAPKGGSLYPVGPSNLFRSEDYPAHEGDVIQTHGMRVTLLEVAATGPRRARFDFEGDPEQFVWLAETSEGLKEVRLPAVGFGAPFDS